MIRKLFYIFALCIVANTSVAMSQINHKTYAIVVGLSKYQNVPSLAYADKDAISFYKYLLSSAGGKADTNDIKLLLDSSATSYNIIRAFQFIKSKVNENDIVYFYFAGHGDVENITDSEMGYLICYSAPPNVYASGGCIPIDYLQECFKAFTNKKAKVIMIVDACKAGKLAGGKDGARQTALALQNEWEGSIKILSCKPGEYSLEGTKWGNGAGVFTYYLLRGLKGLATKDTSENQITLLQLFNYLKENISKDTYNKQNPKYSGDEDFIMSYIDKGTYQTMLNETDTKDITSIRNNKGFEPDISSIKDKFIISQYYLFQFYLEKDKLISNNDAEKDDNNALGIYQSLKNNASAEPLLNAMKESLIAALQNKAQVISNNCLNNNWNFSERKQVYRELATAFNLIDTNYYFYKHIKATCLLWNGITNISNQQSYAKQIDMVNESIALEPDNPLSYFLLAWIYSALRQEEIAIANYDKAIKISSNWEMPLINKGSSLNTLGRFDEAIACFNKVIELDSNSADALVNIAITMTYKGKYEGSIAYFDRAISIDSSLSYAWKYKAAVLEKLGRHQEAIESYEEVFRCYEKSTESNPNDARVWYNVACGYSISKKKHEMLIKLRRAIELDLKYKDMAKSDEDFKEYWNDPDFQSLIR